MPRFARETGVLGRAEMGVEMKGKGLSEGRKTERAKNRVAEKGLKGVIQGRGKKKF